MRRTPSRCSRPGAPVQWSDSSNDTMRTQKRIPRRALTAEEQRLDDARSGKAPWRRWGPYVSERQWGTVREDYSANGTAWEYFPHDHARSRAYRWGEDGIAGICDDRQQLCFALALWNGADPILKERLFGLTGQRGQSRRGRQGVLLLPRQRAQPRVHEVPLQVSAAGVSLRGPGRGEQAARAARPGIRAARYRRSSTTTATSTYSSNTPRRRPTTS